MFSNITVLSRIVKVRLDHDCKVAVYMIENCRDQAMHQNFMQRYSLQEDGSWLLGGEMTKLQHVERMADVSNDPAYAE